MTTKTMTITIAIVKWIGNSFQENVLETTQAKIQMACYLSVIIVSVMAAMVTGSMQLFINAMIASQ
jgi:hypothetical protein